MPSVNSRSNTLSKEIQRKNWNAFHSKSQIILKPFSLCFILLAIFVKIMHSISVTCFMRSKHSELNLVQFLWVVCIMCLIFYVELFHLKIKNGRQLREEECKTNEKPGAHPHQIQWMKWEQGAFGISLFVSFLKELSQKIIFLGLVFIVTMKVYSQDNDNGREEKFTNNSDKSKAFANATRKHSAHGCWAI